MPTEKEMRLRRESKLVEVFYLVFIALKLTGQLLMESHWVENIVSVSHLPSTLVVLGPWLGVVLGVTSHFFCRFLVHECFFFLLVTTAPYMFRAQVVQLFAYSFCH